MANPIRTKDCHQGHNSSSSNSRIKELAMYENVTWHNQTGALLLTRTQVIFKTTNEDSNNENEGRQLQQPEKSIKWSWTSMKKMQVNKSKMMIRLWSSTQKGKSVTFALESTTEVNKLRSDVSRRLRLGRPTAHTEYAAAMGALAKAQQDTASFSPQKRETMDHEVEERPHRTDKTLSVVVDDTFKGSMTAAPPPTSNVESCLIQTGTLPNDVGTKKTPIVKEHLDSDSDTCSISSADEEASLDGINESNLQFTNEVVVVPRKSSSSAITLKKSTTSTNLLGKKLRQILDYLLPNLSFFFSP